MFEKFSFFFHSSPVESFIYSFVFNFSVFPKLKIFCFYPYLKILHLGCFCCARLPQWYCGKPPSLTLPKNSSTSLPSSNFSILGWKESNGKYVFSLNWALPCPPILSFLCCVQNHIIHTRNFWYQNGWWRIGKNLGGKIWSLAALMFGLLNVSSPG